MFALHIPKSIGIEKTVVYSTSKLNISLFEMQRHDDSTSLIQFSIWAYPENRNMVFIFLHIHNLALILGGKEESTDKRID